MARLLRSTECLGSLEQLPYYKPKTVSTFFLLCLNCPTSTVSRNICKLSLDTKSAKSEGIKANQRGFNYCVKMCSTSSNSCFETLQQPRADRKSKQVWIWTESKQVMTAAVERGWSTFIFSPEDRELAIEWSSIAMIYPLFIMGQEVLNEESKRVAKIFEVSSPQELQQLQPENEQAENVIVQLLDWQIIPAENIVAAFQGSQKTVFAISKTPLEARVFLEALEQGLGGIVLKVENVEAILELKDYFDKINEAKAVLSLTKVTITHLQAVGMGDRICVDLCSLMKPGEGLLVGSFARGLFLVHSECLESKYISSRPFRVNAVRL
ncbi:hypothetical protein K2173_020050 [Erythroxylum novogranatense]|uniref:3-dehydroquinate synthase n=1 Tax=Erythroxylum novogranatense TaxID=1862640 RepID=A0AAV8U6V4_9ROSI|nr:hypothetical protein K2173_020050 [Erythroxylum novogranatense]